MTLPDSWWRAVAALVFFVVVVGLPGHAAKAQQTPAFSVALIDVQRILRESGAAEGVRKKMEGYRASLQAEVGQEETELRKVDEELKRQRSLLSPEALDQRRREFQQRVTDFQRRVQERRRAYDRSGFDAMNRIRDEVLRIVQEIGAERKITLVLDTGQVIFFHANLEITDQVLEQLNKRLPKVEVVPPGSQ